MNQTSFQLQLVSRYRIRGAGRGARAMGGERRGRAARGRRARRSARAAAPLPARPAARRVASARRLPRAAPRAGYDTHRH